MKKFLLLLWLFSVTMIANANNTAYEVETTVAEQPSKDDMECVASTTAYRWNAPIWQGQSAYVYRNQRDGSYWIKIHELADPRERKCQVKNNPDYGGKLDARGGRRTSSKYMATYDVFIYYFNF